MWTWFNCYLSGRHEYGPWCQPGTIFLRCIHCGRRSSGWAIESKPHAHTGPSPAITMKQVPAPVVVATAGVSRVLPFTRAAAR
jgi:hypothetical protein